MKRIVYIALAATIAISLGACGRHTDAYYSTESNTEDIQGTAKEHNEDVDDPELLEQSELEQLDLAKYLVLGAYQNVYQIPEGALAPTGNDKTDYENRKKVVDNILQQVVANTQFTEQIKNIVNQKKTELTVQYMNKASKDKKSIEQYAADLGYKTVDELWNAVEKEAEVKAKQQLVTYAIAQSLQIQITDQQYEAKAKDLALFDGYASVKEMIQELGTEQIRLDIVSYTTAGVAGNLINANGGNEDTSQQHVGTGTGTGMGNNHQPDVTDRPSQDGQGDTSNTQGQTGNPQPVDPQPDPDPDSDLDPDTEPQPNPEPEPDTEPQPDSQPETGTDSPEPDAGWAPEEP